MREELIRRIDGDPEVRQRRAREVSQVVSNDDVRPGHNRSFDYVPIFAMDLGWNYTRIPRPIGFHGVRESFLHRAPPVADCMLAVASPNNTPLHFIEYFWAPHHPIKARVGKPQQRVA